MRVRSAVITQHSQSGGVFRVVAGTSFYRIDGRATRWFRHHLKAQRHITITAVAFQFALIPTQYNRANFFLFNESDLSFTRSCLGTLIALDLLLKVIYISLLKTRQ